MKDRSLSKKPSASRPRGRPRKFDVGSVCEQVAQVFWARGYRGTSLEDICAATGLQRGSLYGAFGDKHGMLLAAIEHYSEGSLAQLSAGLNTKRPAREALRGALVHYTRTTSQLEGLGGCFITNTTLEMMPDDAVLFAQIELFMRRTLTLLTATVIRGQAEGAFDPTLDEKAVGDFLLGAIQGLRVLGKIVREEDRLMAVVDMTMRAIA